VPQCLKVCLQVQLHEEVVNCSFVHQGDTGWREGAWSQDGGQNRADGYSWADKWHSLGSQWCHEGAFHEHRQRQQLTQLHHSLVHSRLDLGIHRKGKGPGKNMVYQVGNRRLCCREQNRLVAAWGHTGLELPLPAHCGWSTHT
jgi:hypothetical protein